MSALTILAGAFTGLLLGLLGSGGSIVTMPALMYLLDIDPKPAIAMSLGIVGATALVSALQHWWRGNVNMPVVLVFGLFGAAGTFVGAKIGTIMPTELQLALFTAIMYVAAYKMLMPSRSAHSIPATNMSHVRQPNAGQVSVAAAIPLRHGPIAVHGVTVGILTGIVGVGGGFLIVPALVLLSNLSMKEAVGTSLLIIAMKSFAGFAGYAGSVPMNFTLLGTFTAVAIVGGVAGGFVSHKVPGMVLRKGFAVFLVVVATYILLREFTTSLV